MRCNAVQCNAADSNKHSTILYMFARLEPRKLMRRRCYMYRESQVRVQTANADLLLRQAPITLLHRGEIVQAPVQPCCCSTAHQYGDPSGMRVGHVCQRWASAKSRCSLSRECLGRGRHYEVIRGTITSICWQVANLVKGSPIRAAIALRWVFLPLLLYTSPVSKTILTSVEKK